MYEKPMITVYTKKELEVIEAQARSKCCPQGKINS